MELYFVTGFIIADLSLVRQTSSLKGIFNYTTNAPEPEYKHPEDSKGVVLVALAVVTGIVLVGTLYLLLSYLQWMKCFRGKGQEEQTTKGESKENLKLPQLNGTDSLPLMTSTSQTDADTTV